jgi:cell division protein FtsZ
MKREESVQEAPIRNNVQQSDDALDIPTFLRNRNKRR